MTRLFWSTVDVLGYLFTFMHTADSFIQSDLWRLAFTAKHYSLQFQHVPLFISHVSSVANRTLKNLHASCSDPLTPKFPSDGNICRPQYPSRLHKEASWSQNSCVVSFPQKKPVSLYHIVILIKWWNADTYVRPLESLYCSCFSFRGTHTLWEGASSIRSNPLLELHTGG